MTGNENGLISIWQKNPGYKSTNRNEIQLQDHSIVNTFNCGGERPLIKVVDQDIIVASRFGKLLVLDTTLKIKKQYNTINYQPRCLSASEKYIAVGTYYDGDVIFYDRNDSTEPTVRIKLRK